MEDLFDSINRDFWRKESIQLEQLLSSRQMSQTAISTAGSTDSDGHSTTESDSARRWNSEQETKSEDCPESFGLARPASSTCGQRWDSRVLDASDCVDRFYRPDLSLDWRHLPSNCSGRFLSVHQSVLQTIRLLS